MRETQSYFQEAKQAIELAKKYIWILKVSMGLSVRS